MPTRRHSTTASSSSSDGAASYTLSTHADSTRTRRLSRPSLLQQRRSAVLPYSLQKAVPSCARNCLEDYIIEQFSGCFNNDNLTCLCTKYSSEGYTLGELAFICLDEGCPSATYSEQQDTYGICSAEAGAASATHSTLTLPATATSFSGVTTTTVDLYVTPSTSSTSSKSTSQLTPVTTTAASSSASAPVSDTAVTMAPVTTTSSSTSASASAATASAIPPHHSSALSSAQAVGVSVAAFGGLAVVVIIIWLCACLRRRRTIAKSPTSKHDSYDFIDDAPSRLPPFNGGYAELRGPFGLSTDRKAELPSEKRPQTQWPSDQSPDQMKEKYGALGFDFARNTSPESQKSHESLRTLSQLLPDKPGSSPPRPPSKRFPVRPRSEDTVFEEYRTPKAEGAKFIGLPARPKPARKAIAATERLAGLRPHYNAQLARKPIAAPEQAAQLSPQYLPPLTRSPEQLQQPLRSPEQQRQPSLSIELPRKASRMALKVPSPIAIIPPSTPSSRRTSRGSKGKSGASSAGDGSVLDYYTSPTEIEVPLPTPRHPLGVPLTPMSMEPQRRLKPAPTAIKVARPVCPPKALRRPSTDSIRSDTSFESTDPDEPTPPEEDKQLSPVAEHSPIAGIKYPKIPRSSNQAVPRSPAVKLSPGVPWPHERQERKVGDGRATLPSQARQAGGVVKRSPKTPEDRATDVNTLSGSTLAAKRRGDSEGREKRLVIDTSHSRAGSRPKNNTHRSTSDQRTTSKTPPSRPSNKQDSPLRGYGRVTSVRTASSGLLSPEMQSPGPTVVRYVRGPDGIVGQEVKLKSPLWEPKLTPSRRGEDLVLEVGVASPGMIGMGTPGVGRAR